jgi:hypothetical protein
MGSLFVLGLILGVVLTLIIVGGRRRQMVNAMFPIALAVAVVVTLLGLLTSHGLAALGGGALLFVGEGIGIIGSAVLAPRVYKPLDSNR